VDRKVTWDAHEPRSHIMRSFHTLPVQNAANIKIRFTLLFFLRGNSVNTVSRLRVGRPGLDSRKELGISSSPRRPDRFGDPPSHLSKECFRPYFRG